MKVKTGLLLGAAAALVGLTGGVLQSIATPIEGAYAADVTSGQTIMTLVTDASTLKAGDQFVIGCPSQGLVMGDQVNTNYRGNVALSTLNSSTQSFLYDESYALVTLEGEAGAWNLKVDGGYLTLTADENHLYTKSSAGTWTIEIDAGIATISPTAYSARNIQYNASSPRFACYKGTQKDVSIYRAAEGSEPVVSIAADVEWISADIDRKATLNASVINLDGDVTYTWSAAENSTDLIEVVGNGASATVTARAGVSGTATVNVVASNGEKQGTATFNVEVMDVLTVAEMYASTKEGDYVLVGGYIVSEDTYTNDSSDYHLADASVGGAIVNGTDEIDLYDYDDKDFVLGEYLVIYGKRSSYNGNQQIAANYDVMTRDFSVDLLAGFILGSEVEPQCEFKYGIAKSHFLGMSEEEQATFKTSADGTIAAARERYEAWASAMGDTNAYEATTGAFNGNFGNDGMTYTLIALASLLAVSLAGLAVYFAIRKKKANKA